MKNLKLLLMWLWSFIYHTTPQYIIKEKVYPELNYKKYFLYRRDYFLLYIPIYRFVDETDNLKLTKDYQSWCIKYNVINIYTKLI